MTHPPEWMIGEPCPVCGSPDILECELRICVGQITMGWECRECGYSTTWTTDADDDAGHIIERRIVERMPLHAITTRYGERGLRERLAAETARFGDATGRRKIKQALQLSPGNSRVIARAVLTYDALGLWDQAIATLNGVPPELLSDLNREPDLADFSQDPRFRQLVVETLKGDK